MITLKYNRPTDKEHGHTVILKDGKDIGYFMQEKSKRVAIGENWYLSLSLSVEYTPKHLWFKTRKELISFIELIMKRRITLKYNRQWNEFIVMVFDENGKYIETESYFTDDKQDATDTMAYMQKEYTEKGYTVI